MNEGLIALLTAIFTTIGVKVVERLLPSTDKKMDDATQIRQELRKEVSDLREYVNKVEAREDELRAKIRQVEDENSALGRKNTILDENITKLKEELDASKKREVDLAKEKDELEEKNYRAERRIDELSRALADAKLVPK